MSCFILFFVTLAFLLVEKLLFDVALFWEWIRGSQAESLRNFVQDLVQWQLKVRCCVSIVTILGLKKVLKQHVFFTGSIKNIENTSGFVSDNISRCHRFLVSKYLLRARDAELRSFAESAAVSSGNCLLLKQSFFQYGITRLLKTLFLKRDVKCGDVQK